jgi:hypothetical protein
MYLTQIYKFTKTYYNTIIKALGLSLAILTILTPNLSVVAQVEGSSPSNINLAITKVVKDGKDQLTEKVSAGKFSVSETLSNDDAIKYSWDGTRISTSFKDNPALCCG